MGSSSASAVPVLPLHIKIMIACQSMLTDISRRSNYTINRSFLNLFNYFVNISSNEKPIEGIKAIDIVVDPNKNLFLLPWWWNIPAVVVSANYRLSPEYRFPTQYGDGLQSLRFLDSKISHEFPANADLSRCFLADDSAGGNLAHHVAVPYSAEIDDSRELKVIGLIAIESFFSGEERTESELRLKNVPIVPVEKTDWHWKAFLPEGCDRDHEAVNVFGPKSGDISGLSKFPVTLVRFGKEVYLVEYPKAIHIFYGFPELIESSLLINDMKKFIEKNSSLGIKGLSLSQFSSKSCYLGKQGNSFSTNMIMYYNCLTEWQ
ncbi:hypothetical protein MKX01_041947 [Papaver californicum]|nr:hypothetical protein MKX01_041947 [Papaver californicum]